MGGDGRDRETGQVLGVFASGDDLVLPTLILFGGPDDDLFVGSRRTPRSILQYDGHTGDFVRTFASSDADELTPMLVHPNGNLIVGTGFQDTLLEFDFETGDLVRTFAHEGLDFATFGLVLQLCPADLDEDGLVDLEDLVALLDAWGNEGGPEDLDGSGTVDFGDLLIVLDSWGPCE